MQKIKVIGVGPGGAAHLTPAAAAALREAKVLIGGKRHLDSFAGDDQEKLVLTDNFREMLELIRNRRESGVAVLASGDPGLYGILKYLRKHFDPWEIEVIPGLSSVQLAFARLSMPWDDAVILSAHGRPAEKLAELAEGMDKVVVLTGTKNPPEKIYELLGRGKAGKMFYLCFDLSLPGEAVVRLRPGEPFPDEYKGRHNCVMVMVNE
ncbi:MAG: precorrin-6y C5,15-methyltransferase (decarboxylating) subunit CbiE [Peptococcaceae bacterium]|nr:precorrin-6y C5,15-methyltransferase (decarboxylating) subunit CbiE [Peptococcaceae bacterium]